MRNSYIFAPAILLTIWLSGQLTVYGQQTRIPLDHSVYEDWKTLENATISNDGHWASYEVNPQKGDGFLYLVNLKENTIDSVPRGYNPVFSNQSDFLVFRIKPPYAMVRQAKKDKKKKDEMPRDSLGIWLTPGGEPLKIPHVKSFRVPEDGTGWFAYHHDEKEDTTKTDSASKSGGSEMVIMHPLSGKKHTVKHVVVYEVSRQGRTFGFVQKSSDTIPVSTVSYFDTEEEETVPVFDAQGKIPRLALDEPGKQLAFLHHPDTSKVVGFDLYRWNASDGEALRIVDTLTAGMPAGWGVSKHGEVWYSGDGTKLFFGTAPKPVPENKDTLLEEEKFRVDVWNWKDTLLQPMQKERLDREKKRTYLAVYHPRQETMVQLADEKVPETRTLYRGNGDILLGLSWKTYGRLISWESSRYQDVYMIDAMNGERKLVLEKKSSVADLSPHGKYLLWYEKSDSSWYAHDVEDERMISLTHGLPVVFYDELFDQPHEPNPYGFAGWSGDDRYVFIYDRYDMWKFDLKERQEPVNLTNGYGRKTNTRFRYQKIDREAYYISLEEPLFLGSFNEKTKETGFYSSSPLIPEEPVELISGPFRYRSPEKSRYGEILIWRRGNFREYPDLYTSDLTFSEYHRISTANPQASKYLWGDARLVHWMSHDNEQLDGILYTPEQMDEDTQYPMLVYFYEKESQNLYRHRIPSPSRSTINIPYCVSNGYVVFIPDIHYKDGHPGKSAYNCIISGTMAMADRFSFIDREHMGIQGQSWGGYQVAYLVTQINPYAAAMAGAPVSNMTSAYGGIRWGSGMSRMMQYEEGQSRIGGTLWDKTSLYLENSPLFHTPDIETPLLIMHNDNDGAVPWYQGIELFVALRRLQKPAWMLVYNQEKHNLTRWPNRVDLSIRMMQFFDHYLKGAPVPGWMDRGIPAIEKGAAKGYSTEAAEP